MPPILSFSENASATLSLLGQIRNLTLREHRRIFLDFDACEHITPAAALALVTEVYRCSRLYPSRKLVTGSYPLDERLKQQLVDMGFFEVLGVVDPEQSTDARPYQDGVRYIRFQTGTQSLGLEATRLRDALQQLKGTVEFDATAGRSLYRALTEAMSNVIHHAYSERTPTPSMHNRWWMLGVMNYDERALRVMLMDQGVGIPRTLPRNIGPSALAAFFQLSGVLRPKDADMIKAAMALGRTRYKKKHHGKGLRDLRRFVELCHNGSLTILSRCGKYVFKSNGEEETSQLPSSLGGTLVHWHVDFDSVLKIVKNNRER